MTDQTPAGEPAAALTAPPPLDLPAHLRAADPGSQRAAMRHLAGQAPWADLGWPALVEALMALGRADIPLSRLTEGHVDALRILAEAGVGPDPDALYGVWASRSGGTGLTARRVGHDGEGDDGDDGAWHLSGRLLFASGAGILDRALVTAWPDGDTHVALDTAVAGWPFDTGGWHTRAMEHSRSHRVDLDQEVDARQVGPDDFYLDRWGFFPGGVGVAAVWTGGAARVLDLLDAATGPGERPAAKALRWGRARTDLCAAVALVRQAGRALADRPAQPRDLATVCRAGVGAAVRRLLAQVRLIAGPAALAFDEDLSRAVDDLAMYVAQQSADGDAAHLGRR